MSAVSPVRFWMSSLQWWLYRGLQLWLQTYHQRSASSHIGTCMLYCKIPLFTPYPTLLCYINVACKESTLNPPFLSFPSSAQCRRMLCHQRLRTQTALKPSHPFILLHPQKTAVLERRRQNWEAKWRVTHKSMKMVGLEQNEWKRDFFPYFRISWTAEH